MFFMSTYSLSHLSDFVLLRETVDLVARDRATTAVLLAHVAEVDARKLYLPAAYPSMYAYCTHELRMSEDSAYKHIQAARTARRFPCIFGAITDGRLHLSAVVTLAPHLTESTADELLAAAEHKTRSEIEKLIAERIPKPDLPTLLKATTPAASPATADRLAPGRVPDHVRTSGQPVSPTRECAQLAARPVEAPAPRARVAPLAPERFALQLTMSQSTHDKLRYAQALLSHQVPAGDIAEVLDRALDTLILALEKQKFAATARPHATQRPTNGTRHVPASVKREVWVRDGGQCTFGTEFMRRKRAEARVAATGSRASRPGATGAAAHTRAITCSPPGMA